MKTYNYKSDFDLILDIPGGFPRFQFRGVLTSTGGGEFVFTNADGELTNCFDDDDRLHVVCADHGLAPGSLMLELFAVVDDPIYPSGLRKVVGKSGIGVKLSSLGADITPAEIEAALPLAVVTAYDIAKANGYEGSEADYVRLTAEAADNSAAAAAAARAAERATMAALSATADAEAATAALSNVISRDQLTQEVGGEPTEADVERVPSVAAVRTAVSEAEERVTDSILTQHDYDFIDGIAAAATMAGKATSGMLVKVKAGTTWTYAGLKAASDHDTWMWRESRGPLMTWTEGAHDNLLAIGFMNVDSSITSLYNYFYNAGQMQFIKCRDWDTSNVTDMRSMFSGCKSLVEADVSLWNVSNVTMMSNAFASVKFKPAVRNWDVSRVTDMSGIFFNVPLGTFSLTNWPTHSVTNLHRCCGYGANVDLDFSGWDTKKNVYMSQAFFSCTKLERLNLSGWDTRSVTDWTSWLYGCNVLRWIGVTTPWLCAKTTIPFQAASKLGIASDGTSNGWIELLAEQAPIIRAKEGYGEDEDIPLLEEEDGQWYLNDGISRTIQLHGTLKGKAWAAPHIATLQAKGFTIA